MGKLEAKIDKFLSENNVNYHRQWAVFALMKRARLRKRNLTAQTSTPVLAQPGESLSLLFEI